MAETYGLLLPFDTDDPEFVRGFECGRIWANLRTFLANDMEAPDGHLSFTVRWSSAEMMIRIGEALGLPCRADPYTDETWCEVVFDTSERSAA